MVITSASEDNLQGLIKFVNTIRGDIDFNIFSEVIPSYLNHDNAADYGYNRVVDEAGEELYVKVAEEVDSKIQSEVVSFAHDKLSSFFIENNMAGADMTLGSLNSLSSVLGDVDKIITFNNNRVDINAAHQEVMNTPMSPEERQERLRGDMRGIRRRGRAA